MYYCRVFSLLMRGLKKLYCRYSVTLIKAQPGLFANTRHRAYLHAFCQYYSQSQIDRSFLGFSCTTFDTNELNQMTCQILHLPTAWKISLGCIITEAPCQCIYCSSRKQETLSYSVRVKFERKIMVCPEGTEAEIKVSRANS